MKHLNKFLLSLLLITSLYGQPWRYDDLLNPLRKPTYALNLGSSNSTKYESVAPKFVSVGQNLLAGWDLRNWFNVTQTTAIISNSFTTIAPGGIGKALFVPGRKYSIDIAIQSLTATSVQLYTYSNGNFQNISSAFSELKSYHFEFTATYTNLYILLNSAGSVTIASISLYEASGSLDQHSNNKLLNPANGDFESGSLGSELISNTSFATNKTGWNDAGNHTSARITTDDRTGSGSCLEITSTGVGSYSSNDVKCTLSSSITQGKLIQIEFWAKSISGSTSLKFDGSYIASNIISITTSWQKYTFIKNTVGPVSLIDFYLLNSGVFRLDDVSTKEIISDWTGTGNCTVNISGTQKHGGSYSLQATFTGTGDANNCLSLASSKFDAFEANKKYTVEKWVYDNGTTTGTDKLAGWDFTSGWVLSGAAPFTTIVDNNTFTTTSTSRGVYKSIFTIGKIYKVVFASSLSNTELRNGSDLSGSLIGTGNGTFYFTAATTALLIRQPNENTTVDVTTLTAYEISPTSITLNIGDQSKTFALTAGQWVKCPFTFTATSSTVGQPLKVWATQASTLYVDDVQICEYWPFSFSGYFKCSGSSIFTLFSKSTADNSTQYGFNCYVYTGKITFSIGDGYIRVSTSSNATINDNKWHLLTVIYDASLSINNLSILIDGVLDKQTNSAIGVTNNSQSFTVGKLSYASIGYFSGYLGQLQILRNYAMTLSEHQAIYRRGYFRPSSYSVFFQDLRGSTDTEIFTDRSGTGNNTTAINIGAGDKVKANYRK